MKNNGVQLYHKVKELGPVVEPAKVIAQKPIRSSSVQPVAAAVGR